MIPSDVRAAHEALSVHNVRFMEFVQRHPACLEKRSFKALSVENELVPYPLQPWPTFISTRMVEELGRINVLLCELIKSLPKRVFGNDPVRLAEFYRLDPGYAALLSSLLADQEYMDGLIARGDYVNTASGLKCLEINMGGNLGGWKAPIWAEMYTRVPLFQRFLHEESLRYRHRSPVELFFAHAIERARRTGLLDGQLNIAFIVPAESRSGPEVQIYANHELRRALQRYAPGVGGEVVVCDYPALESLENRLSFRGRRIHAVVEHTFGRADRQVLHSLQAGQVNVYDGPATEILIDKRNLALLSEHQGSDIFDANERAVIAAHVPWTRTVRPGPTTYRGEVVRLPDFLLERREELVLKPARSAKGEGVQVGRVQSREKWILAVESAIGAPESWLVQEYAESLPYFYQAGEAGCSEHDLIWGLFAFGQTYGGGFLRMMPKAGSKGIVNAAQGATEGVFMEVDQ